MLANGTENRATSVALDANGDLLQHLQNQVSRCFPKRVQGTRAAVPTDSGLSPSKTDLLSNGCIPVASSYKQAQRKNRRSPPRVIRREIAPGTYIAECRGGLNQSNGAEVRANPKSRTLTTRRAGPSVLGLMSPMNDAPRVGGAERTGDLLARCSNWSTAGEIRTTAQRHALHQFHPDSESGWGTEHS